MPVIAHTNSKGNIALKNWFQAGWKDFKNQKHEFLQLDKY